MLEHSFLWDCSIPRYSWLWNSLEWKYVKIMRGFHAEGNSPCVWGFFRQQSCFESLAIAWRDPGIESLMSSVCFLMQWDQSGLPFTISRDLTWNGSLCSSLTGQAYPLISSYPQFGALCNSWHKNICHAEFTGKLSSHWEDLHSAGDLTQDF